MNRNGEIIDLGDIVEDALRTLRCSEETAFVPAICSVVRQNYASGRLYKVINNTGTESVSAYVKRVCGFYEEWHDYVQLIQVDQDQSLWEELFEQLQRWAKSFLRKKRVPYAHRTQYAMDCAADAGAVIASSHYPYDVNFEAWTYVLLRNVSYQYLDKKWNGRSISQEQIVHAEQWDGWLESIEDPAACSELKRLEWRQVLQRSLAALPPGQMEALTLVYVEDLSYDEASKCTGRSKSALYKAVHEARNTLRVALAADVVKVYEN